MLCRGTSSTRSRPTRRCMISSPSHTGTRIHFSVTQSPIHSPYQEDLVKCNEIPSAFPGTSGQAGAWRDPGAEHSGARHGSRSGEDRSGGRRVRGVTEPIRKILHVEIKTIWAGLSHSTQMQPDLTDRLVAALSDGTTLHRIALGSTLDQRAAPRDSAIRGEGTREWQSI